MKTLEKEDPEFGKRKFDSDESSEDEDPKNIFAKSFHKMYEFKPDQS